MWWVISSNSCTITWKIIQASSREVDLYKASRHTRVERPTHPQRVTFQVLRSVFAKRPDRHQSEQRGVPFVEIDDQKSHGNREVDSPSTGHIRTSPSSTRLNCFRSTPLERAEDVSTENRLDDGESDSSRASRPPEADLAKATLP